MSFEKNPGLRQPFGQLWTFAPFVKNLSLNICEKANGKGIMQQCLTKMIKC